MTDLNVKFPIFLITLATSITLHFKKYSLWMYYRRKKSIRRQLLLQTSLRTILIFILICFTPAINAQTISSKRGVAGDLLDNSDCIAVDSLTWFYNWANTPNSSVINSSQNYLEYCPMLWNGTWDQTALTNYLNAHPEVKYLLTFNEPNYSVQANMTPAQAVSYWPQIEAIANTYNLKIVSPAMSYCSGTCLSGYNNMDGTKWLDDFFAACPDCRVDYIAIHIYDTWYYGFQGNVNPYVKYGKPIWVTEFDYSGATTSTQHASLMVDVIDYMEKNPLIFRYAWFLVRSSPSAGSTDIFSQTTGTLADLGNIYTRMSSYDSTYYHNVNSIIEAEYYISKSVIYCNWNGSACTWPYSILLEPTTDVSGRLDAYNFASPTANTNDTIFYNVNIPTTQTYTMDFRVNSTTASTISVRTYPGNALLGTTASLNTSGAWSTKILSGVNLTAGKQKIYLTASNGTPLKLNWLRINCNSNCGNLPIKIESFNASRLSSNSALLEWVTTSDKSLQEFIIEKSTDGINFDSIGVIKEQQAEAGTQMFSYIDASAFGDLIYYRIKAFDTNREIIYSPLISLSNKQNSIKVVSKSIITELTTEQEVYYVISDLMGQSVMQGNYHANKGIKETPIPFNDQSKGIYFIKVLSEGISYSGKIIYE